MILNYLRAHPGNTVAQKLERITNNLKSSGKIKDIEFLLRYVFLLKKPIEIIDCTGVINVEEIENYYKAYTVLDNIKKVCNEIHKDNWTFDIYVNPENLSDRKLSLNILYPSFNITNEDENETHTIENLLVCCFIEIDDFDIFILPTLRGQRLSTTYEELYNNYPHSHLGSSSFIDNNLMQFCLGSNSENPFCDSALYSKGQMTDIDIVTNLILTIENYISYESKEGGPYQYFNEIPSDLPLSSLNDRYYVYNGSSPRHIDSYYIENFNRRILPDLIISFQNNQELLQEFLNNLDINIKNEFLMFKEIEKFKKYLILALKKWLLETEYNERNLDIIFTCIYQKISNNNYNYIQEDGNDNFNFTVWLNDKKIGLRLDTYFYQIDNKKINFYIQNEGKYDDFETVDNSQHLSSIIINNLETWEIQDKVIQKLFKEINDDTIYSTIENNLKKELLCQQ
jgi:hypothetical protein